jgi:DNA-binding NarL/FixJ family response regulator
MDGPRVRTFDVVLATVVGGALVVVTPVIDRERGVLTLVGGGLSNEEIAAELFISVATAPTHVSRAMTKLHARDRAQLVVAAYESGLVTPGQR